MNIRYPIYEGVYRILTKKETLREINLYNSVIQAVENVFHIAWKE